MSSTLIPRLVATVLAKQQEQANASIEQILNEAGIHSVQPQVMAEIRAEVYYSLNLGISIPGALQQHLIYFIADYEVFRVSELRYYFPGDREQQLKINLEQLGYVMRENVRNELEPIWCPKFMQSKTIARKLNRRRIGSKEYLDYLFYQPPSAADPIARH